MPKKDLKTLEERIKAFVFRLKKDFGDDIQTDPSRFKARVIGALRALLPRQRPGRKANPEIIQAAQIYQELTRQGRKGKDGIWHQVAVRACPAYRTLPMDAQRLLRLTLRAAVHSVRHEEAARQRLRPAHRRTQVV